MKKKIHFYGHPVEVQSIVFLFASTGLAGFSPLDHQIKVQSMGLNLLICSILFSAAIARQFPYLVPLQTT